MEGAVPIYIRRDPPARCRIHFSLQTETAFTVGSGFGPTQRLTGCRERRKAEAARQCPIEFISRLSQSDDPRRFIRAFLQATVERLPDTSLKCVSACKIGSDSNLMEVSILCAGEREKLDLVAPHRRPSGRSEASASDNRPNKPAGRQTGVPFIKSASDPILHAETQP